MSECMIGLGVIGYGIAEDLTFTWMAQKSTALTNAVGAGKWDTEN